MMEYFIKTKNVGYLFVPNRFKFGLLNADLIIFNKRHSFYEEKLPESFKLSGS
jgi:hypothetical protein